jgi:hypothetical protein
MRFLSVRLAALGEARHGAGARCRIMPEAVGAPEQPVAPFESGSH